MTDRTRILRARSRAALALFVATLAACGDTAKLAPATGMGPAPTLPAPHSSFIPTVHVATAVGWPASTTPDAAPGLAVNAFATGLDHPRWVYPLPNGDVLVAESNAPVRPDDGKGIRGWFMRRFMRRAGAAVPSPNRIMLLRDADGDGVAERRTLFIGGLNSPFGMALVDSVLYIADTDALLAFSYRAGDTMLTGVIGKVADLPAGTINHHWTKNVIASADGRRLYVTVGSNSNVAENGIAVEKGRAAIVEIDPATHQQRIFASGLRNPNGLGWEPVSGALWAAVNERDEIGSDLVPDYMTSVKDGGFYGWPYSYYGQHVDRRVDPQRPELVATATMPDYALGTHTASLGLAFNTGALFPAHYQGGIFIGQHGSWNRRPFNGYRVIFVPFSGGHPAGDAEVVLSGFLNAEGEARGRPVGVAIDRRGALLVADDVGNAIWRLTPAPRQ
ncbi:MAG: sorbosone dehydrogenase family protein [Gemmatimonadales bacterium]